MPPHGGTCRILESQGPFDPMVAHRRQKYRTADETNSGHPSYRRYSDDWRCALRIFPARQPRAALGTKPTLVVTEFGALREMVGAARHV